MRADLVDRFDNAAFRALLQMDALPGDVETFAETVAALRALRDAPVREVMEFGGYTVIGGMWEDEPELAALHGQQVRLVPLDTTAGVGK
jgi:hypothetical protein